MSDSFSWADHRVFDTEDASGGTSLLYGADHASLFALDPSTRDVLARWRTQDAIVLRDVPDNDREALEALRDAQVLIPSRLRGRAPPAAIDPAEVPLGTLVLEIAQTCNLRCAYCYAGGGSYGGEAQVMRPELARRAARFLVDSSGERESVTLVLFGGEPLLNLASLQAAVTEAEAAAQAAGKRLVVSLTTNGTRFTSAALEFLREHRIDVSISIDGPADVHDANRRFARKNGGGTYGDVVVGLKLLRAHGLRPPAARVTLTPDQWARIPEVFGHLMELGFVEVGIAPVSPVTADLLPTPEQDEALFAAFSLLAERFSREAALGRVLPFSNLLDLLARLHSGHAKTSPCGAGLGYLAVDAKGRFFLCHRLAGAERFAVGDLASGVDHAKIRACLAAQAAPRHEACGTCWARSLCAGGCHYENDLREVQLGLPPGGPCAFIRRWLELGIRVYAELARDPDNPVLAFLGKRTDC